jgi:hypothetical protein
MCHHCNRLDEIIGRYQNIFRSIKDQTTEDGAKLMIAELEAQKIARHPPPVVEHFVSRIGNVGVVSPALGYTRRGARRF